MFSTIFTSQNSSPNITITSVTWSISLDTSATYSGSEQSVMVLSVNPPSATYNLTTIGATNAEEKAYTNLVGTGLYTGSFTSPTLTIVPATISGTPEDYVFYYTGSPQTAKVIKKVTPDNATYSGMVKVTGTDVGYYTSSITGTGNYTGTVIGGVLTILYVLT